MSAQVPVSTQAPLSSPASAPSIALWGERDLDAPLAWRDGQPIAARALLVAATRLAHEVWPADVRGIVNLCHERDDFVMTLLAAALRGLPTLMPPNALPATLALLETTQPGCLHVDNVKAVPPTPTARHEERLVSALKSPLVAPDAVAAILLTSGSTGTPVPHARTWRSVVLNAQAQASRMAEALGRTNLQGLTLVATVPPQHSYGFESSVTLALVGGAAFEAGRPFYPADIVQALERVPRPRALVTTPFHLKTLLASGLTLPAVDVIFSATAPLSPQLAAQAEQALKGPMLEVYGCTEAGQVATRQTTVSPTWTTYGELRIAQRREADGEDGYWVQGGHVFEATALADVLELDDDRHFRLLGRRGDLIHVAGKRSSLAHLTHHLNSIDGVVDGAFWMPDDDAHGGVVRPVALVVAPTLTAAQVSRALHERLDAVFVPRRILMLDTIPREGTGKVTSATLKALVLAHDARRVDDASRAQRPT